MKKILFGFALILLSSEMAFAGCQSGKTLYVDKLYSGKTFGDYPMRVKFKGDSEFILVEPKTDPSAAGHFEYKYIGSMLLNAKILGLPVMVGCENGQIVSVYL
ncbi:hypothetical protein [Aeromonas veronii]|uniref:hypothetical protein n=1 Tax=Aeromonas veronii TaxID=654 RepID=UPI00405595DD